MTEPDSTAAPRRLGRYEVVGRLATGGMAEILLARVVGPQGFVRAVVLKRILDHLATREDFRHMFLDEARIVSRIHHDNVVQVHELGEEDGELFLAMEYLQGETVAGLMRRLVRDGERLPLALAAHIVAEAAAGLHAAHELVDEQGDPLGLVHRDASPHNLFVTYDGSVKLLDFGIARASGRFTQTEAGQIKGKFAYMSPEQCRGQPLDRRSDVFTLGTVLYELSTTRRLFVRDNDMATMRAVCREPLSPPSAYADGYPPELESICLRALERPRASRFASAEELAGQLREVVHRLASGDPRHELGQLMQQHFAERIASKDEMLRRLRAGEHTMEVSAGEVDQAVAVPTVDSPLAEGSRTVDTAVSFDEPKPRRAPWGLGLGMVALGGLAAVLVFANEPADTKPQPPSVAVEEIVINVDSAPPGASVRLDGKTLGTTPLTHRRPQASGTGKLELELDGHAHHTEKLAFDMSQRIFVTMTPDEAEPAPTATTSTAAAPASPPPPRRPPPRPTTSAAPKTPVPKKIYKL